MISGARVPGVVATTSKGQQGVGTPKTVESIFELKQYLVKFYDDAGDGHLDVLVKVGNEYYASPYGEEWCSKLGPAIAWLKSEVARRVAQKDKSTDPETIPNTDSVSITSIGGVHDRLVAETQAYVNR